MGFEEISPVERGALTGILNGLRDENFEVDKRWLNTPESRVSEVYSVKNAVRFFEMKFTKHGVYHPLTMCLTIQPNQRGFPSKALELASFPNVESMSVARIMDAMNTPLGIDTIISVETVDDMPDLDD